MGHPLNGSSEEHARHSAAGMIAVYGDEAEKICRAQVEKMRRRKDGSGERVWENVLLQILQDRARPGQAGEIR